MLHFFLKSCEVIFLSLSFSLIGEGNLFISLPLMKKKDKVKKAERPLTGGKK